MAIPKVPDQCMKCINFNTNDMICKHYEELPGEGSRKEVVTCPSFFDNSQTDDLKLLAEYVREDREGLIDQRIQEAVNNILKGYEEQFKIHIIGIARRKVKAMVKMVDIIDILLGRLSDIDTSTINDMTPSQTIRLLSELNASVNNDLSFIMKLLQPDSNLKDLQMYIDNRTLNINGSSPATEVKAEEILKLTGTSRDKIREAFDAILHSIDVPAVEEVYEPTEDELDEINLL